MTKANPMNHSHTALHLSHVYLTTLNSCATLNITEVNSVHEIEIVGLQQWVTTYN